MQKHIFTRDLDSIANSLVQLMTSSQVQLEHELFNGLVYYMLLIGETSNVQKVIETLLTIDDYREDVMNAAQQLKQQGLQQGLQKGLQQGRHEGELSLAKKLLNRGIDLDLIKSAGGFSEQELLELEES